MYFGRKKWQQNQILKFEYYFSINIGHQLRGACSWSLSLKFDKMQLLKLWEMLKIDPESVKQSFLSFFPFSFSPHLIRSWPERISS